MCKAIEMALENVGMGLENTISELDLLVAEDENFRNSRAVNKMNRANRRRKNTEKKLRLGKEYRHSYEHIDAYWTEKVQDGDDVKKITHWVYEGKDFNGMTVEEYYDYINSIPWEKVKGINPKKMGWAEYNRGNRQWSRKERHQKFHEEYEVFSEDIIDPITGEVLVQKGEDWKYVEFSDWKALDMERYIRSLDDDEKLMMGYNPKGEFERYESSRTKIYEDARLIDKLIACKRAIKAWNALLDLERQRAMIMAMVHEADWKIRFAVAELNEAENNCK